jgi:hypothetical protein
VATITSILGGEGGSNRRLGPGGTIALAPAHLRSTIRRAYQRDGGE